MFRNNTQYQTKFFKMKISVPEQKYNTKLKRIIDEALMCASLFKDSFGLGESFGCLMLCYFCFSALFVFELNNYCLLVVVNKLT